MAPIYSVLLVMQEHSSSHLSSDHSSVNSLKSKQTDSVNLGNSAVYAVRLKISQGSLWIREYTHGFIYKIV